MKHQTIFSSKDQIKKKCRLLQFCLDFESLQTVIENSLAQVGVDMDISVQGDASYQGLHRLY